MIFCARTRRAAILDIIGTVILSFLYSMSSKETFLFEFFLFIIIRILVDLILCFLIKPTGEK